MTHKLAIVCDPGIDGAFALTLALHDPNLEVLGLAATAGNVSAEQATRNAHIVIEQLDPTRWPRLGEALAVEYDVAGTQLHGQNGLGNSSFPCARLHSPVASDKLLVELVRQYPEEVTVLCLGPLTVVASALERDGEFRNLVHRLVCVGGTIAEPGNAGPVSEFHFYCDPLSARMVLNAAIPTTLIPLDVTRKLIFAPTDMQQLPPESTNAGRFLRRLIPYAISATSNIYGIEGFHLKDVVGLAEVAVAGAVKTQTMSVDVEVRGELTRGMTVADRRTWRNRRPNVEVATEIDVRAVREYMDRILQNCGA
jgi:inosine-uridine nucleoside N-ribohydrolase